MIIRAFVVQVYESMTKKMIFDFRTLMTKLGTTLLWGKEMLHKTTKYICLICVMLLPLNVYALGFGKIKTNSALNDIMDAEIPLLSASKSDIGSLEIKLASREVFQRFGTDRPSMLMLLKFEVKQRSGLSFIKITSKKAIREPFLDFWLEMNSKNERIIKNFVVLLDPPHLKQPNSSPSIVNTPVAEPIEPEPLIEDSVSEPQDSPFTDPEPSILDEPPVASSAPTEALFPDENEQQQDTIATAEPLEAEEPKDLIAEPDELEAQAAEALGLDELESDMEPIEPEPIQDEVDLAVDDSQAESFAGDEEGLFPRTALDEYNEPTEDQFTEPAEQELADEAPEADFDAEPAADTFDDNADTVADNQDSEPVGDLDYGITKKNDNLWRIAESLRAGSSSISIYQIMMALLQSNPDAFIDNNVHRLKVGFVLRVEDKGLLTQMTRSQAAQMYAEQTEQWKSFRQDIASNVETQAVDTSEVSFSEAEPEEDINSGELTLASPDSLEPEVSTGIEESADAQQLSDLAILRDDLKRAISEATTSGSDNPELSKKLLDLEDEINSMQRMLTVEDDELASLQQQLHEINERNAMAAENSAVIEPEPAMDPEPVLDEAPAANDETQLAQSNPEDVGEPEEINPEEILEGGDDTQASETMGEETVAEQAQDTTNPDEEEAAPTPEDTQDSGSIMGMVSGVIDALVSNIIYIGGAIAAIILLIITMVMLKRRNADSDGSNESILLGSEDNDNTISSLTKEVEVASGGPVSGEVDSTSSEESSFLSDFAISGMNAIEEDNEVDPLTEADVFMAYGRYEAAEERLQDAIKTDPNRSELKLKLIELYYTTKNKEAFESTAEEFYASLGGNAGADPMWEKVLSMGAEIAPDNPIFSGGTPLEDGASVSSASMSASDVMDIGLDTGVFDSTDLSSKDTTETALDTDTAADTGGDYNFDLGIDTTGDLSGDIAKEESSGLEFDLNLDTNDNASIEDDSNSLDFNLDSTDATEEMNPARAGSMEFELGSSLDIDPVADTNIESESELMDLGLDDSSDNSESTAEIDASGLDFDLPDNDLSLDDDLDLSAGMDEVGTKLDLAKAYIDMGDSNGARSILDEVIDEGNDSQKQEAQELIHQIV